MTLHLHLGYWIIPAVLTVIFLAYAFIPKKDHEAFHYAIEFGAGMLCSILVWLIYFALSYLLSGKALP